MYRGLSDASTSAEVASDGSGRRSRERVEEDTSGRPETPKRRRTKTAGMTAKEFDELVSGLEGASPTAVRTLCEEASKPRRELFLDTNAGLHAVLVALESSDDAIAIALCNLLLAYVQEGRTNATKTRRARRLVSVDALSTTARALRRRLQTPFSPAMNAVVDLLIVVSLKDPKSQWKMRVGGTLHSLCEQIVDGSTPLSERLLRVVARFLRSPRNAQYGSRIRDFPRSVLLRATESRHTETMARHLEILYLICKNKKARSSMMAGGAVRSLVALLDRLAGQIKDQFPPLEASLIVVGLLKLFANSRRGKEEVLAAGMVAACEKCLNAIGNATEKAAIQLQDAICSLCIRCVPAEKFPLDRVAFPLSLTLPAVASTPTRRPRTTSEGAGLSSKRNRRLPTSYARAEESGRSSDEDQDDVDDELAEELGEESGGSDVSDDDADPSSTPMKKAEVDGIRKQSDMPDLASYAHLFVEQKEGASLPLIEEPEEEEVRRRDSRGRADTPTRIPPAFYTNALKKHAQKTRSLMRWVKIAYPDLAGPDRELPLQPLVFSTNSMRQVAARATKRSERSASAFKPRVVYDLDALLGSGASTTRENRQIDNDDRIRIGKVDNRGHLAFESRFEGGNLRAAIQTDRTHYELVLQPDINQARDHFQWFYFEISNGEANVEYTFEIINCMKTTSMFVHGMQPVAYSVGEAMGGRPGWVRVGHSICYYRNQYVVDEDLAGHRKDRFFSLRFTLSFRHRGDVCYVAYHFPYSYSHLQATLECWLGRTLRGVYARADPIGESLGGNALSLVTVTAPGSSSEISGRDMVIFTARVHPGESNASWIMHGILEYLLTSEDALASEARELLVFKCIPMLNPDGVLSGNHRCSLSGHDLNRVWDSPSRSLHPEIFHAKAIVQAAHKSRLPLLFVDLHGHSRRSNCFLYGNNPDQSWFPADLLGSPSLEFVDYAEIMENTTPAFSARSCRWAIQRSKEGSARVALWRQLHLPRCYTLECTYSGFESGAYKGYQIGISEMKEIGRNLVQSALELVKMKTTT